MTIEELENGQNPGTETAEAPAPPDPEAERAALLAEMEAAEAEATGQAQEPEPKEEPQPEPEGEDEFEAGKKADEPDPEAGPEKPEAKPSDEFGELGKDVKADTRERFEKLKASYDELHAKAAQAEQFQVAHERMQEWEGIIAESTARPEQLTDALHLIRAINSDDPQILGAAYEKLTAELAMIGKRIGREAPGYDPMAEHDDLRTAIENGDITREHAAEVVKARALAARQQQAAQSQQQGAQQQAQAQQAEQQALEEVNALNARLKAEDAANFDARLKAIDYAEIRKHPPHLWAAKIEAAYWRAQPAAPKAPAAPNPLRPTVSGNRSLAAKPTSGLEAVEQALAAAGLG